MKLYSGISNAIIAALNANAVADWATTSSGGMSANAVMDFYTTNAGFSALATAGGAVTGGMLTSTQRIYFAAVPAATIAGAANPAGTRNTGTFAFSAATGTVNVTGNVAYFAIFNSNTTSPLASNIVLTGTVATQSADINFNVTGWQQNDQVSITSLTFVQPNL